MPAVALAVLANAIGGASYAMTARALCGLGESAVVAVRTVVALTVLLPLAGLRPVAAILAQGGRRRALLLAMSLLGYAVPLLLASHALRRSTSTHAALLIGIEPITVGALGALCLGEHLGVHRLAAFAFGLAGASAVAGAQATAGDGAGTIGDILLVVHAAAWGIYTIAAKPLLRDVDALPLSAASVLVAAPFLVAGAALEPRAALAGALLPAVGWAVTLGLLVSAGVTLLWNSALSRMDASRLAGFAFLQPVVGVALGTVALGEPLTAYAVAGGILVCAGVWLLAREPAS